MVQMIPIDLQACVTPISAFGVKYFEIDKKQFLVIRLLLAVGNMGLYVNKTRPYGFL